MDDAFISDIVKSNPIGFKIYKRPTDNLVPNDIVYDVDTKDILIYTGKEFVSLDHINLSNVKLTIDEVKYLWEEIKSFTNIINITKLKSSTAWECYIEVKKYDYKENITERVTLDNFDCLKSFIHLEVNKAYGLEDIGIDCNTIKIYEELMNTDKGE